MFSKPLSPFTKQKPERSEEEEDFLCFDLKYDSLKRFYKPLTLCLRAREIGGSFANEKIAEGSYAIQEQIIT